MESGPAELPKSVGSFDLPIAVGILAASGQLRSDVFDQYAIVGELALDGSTRAVKGALALAMAAIARRGESSTAGRLRGLVVPSTNAAEAAVALVLVRLCCWHWSRQNLNPPTRGPPNTNVVLQESRHGMVSFFQ